MTGPDEYAELWEANYESAFKFAWSLARDHDVAEDLVADSFVAVMERIDRGVEVWNFQAYLIRAVRNRWRQRYRDADREQHWDGWQWEQLTCDPVPVGDDELAGVSVVFNRLSEPSRRVLWDTAVMGWTPAELAPLYRQSPNAVAAAKYRACVAFRREWEEAA